VQVERFLPHFARTIFRGGATSASHSCKVLREEGFADKQEVAACAANGVANRVAGKEIVAEGDGIEFGIFHSMGL
jgi:hypothetical protein